MKKKERYGKIIIRGVLENALAAGPAIFSAIAEMGAMTIEVFLNPSYYGDFPSGSMFGEYVKEKKAKEITIRQNIRRLQKHGFMEKKGDKYFLTAAGKKLAGMYKPKNLLPMYGYGEKTEEQKKVDEDFISAVVKEAGSREKASIGIAGGARQWLDKGDLDTAMKRYNQAWLLDSNNPEAYFGFAEILKRQGDEKGAEEMLKRAESLVTSKYKEAKLSATIIDIGLALDDWYAVNKKSYLGFMENKANVDKINGILVEIKNEGRIEAEYNIYTVSQNYVAKLKAKGDNNFYCINFEILSEKAKTPDAPFQSIVINGDNFTAKINCDGKSI